MASSNSAQLTEALATRDVLAISWSTNALPACEHRNDPARRLAAELELKRHALGLLHERVAGSESAQLAEAVAASEAEAAEAAAAAQAARERKAAMATSAKACAPCSSVLLVYICQVMKRKRNYLSISLSHEKLVTLLGTAKWLPNNLHTVRVRELSLPPDHLLC